MIRIVDVAAATLFAARRNGTSTEADEIVRPIIDAIRREGDVALLRYSQQFDHLGHLPIRVSPEELASARAAMSQQMLRAVETAIANIKQYAEAQLPRERFGEFSPGRSLGWIVRPLDAVGCYVPSGRYPLPSTLLMTAVLAQTAGVPRICITSPKPSIEILGCAHMLGIDEVYRVGGAQAIAAMAFGTQTIPKVDRIVGPGNAYVATAKKLLAGEVGIDFVAGPTEIVILTEDGDPRLIAADMPAQEEHDTSESAGLIKTSAALAEAVAGKLDHHPKAPPTADVARQAIDRNSFVLVVPNMDLG